jgi:hypothetical protein
MSEMFSSIALGLTRGITHVLTTSPQMQFRHGLHTHTNVGEIVPNANIRSMAIGFR